MKNKIFLRGILIIISTLFFTKPFANAGPVNDAAIIEIKPSALVVSSIGDREKFEEDHWVSPNTSGGIDSMAVFKQLNKQDSLEFEGRAIAGNNDYNADLNLSREGLGSLRIAFTEFRKFYDGTGGFYPFISSPLLPGELDRDLHLDIGKFKIEGILAKEDAPEYKLSYERNFRNGAKSLLGWNQVTGVSTVTGAPVSRKIYPTFKETDEVVDKVKFEVRKETKDSEVSAEQSWEKVRSEDQRLYSQTINLNDANPFGASSTQYLNRDSDLYSTTLRFSKELNKNLSVNCGMLFNRFVGGSLELLEGATNIQNPAQIEQNSVTLFPNIYFTPFKNLSMSFGSKAEYIVKNGNSLYNSTADPFRVSTVSDTDEKIFTQNLQLKYNGMKNAVWYANAAFEKRFINQFENSDSSTNPGASQFSRKTNTFTDNNNFTLGCKWYPLSKVNLTFEDKYKNEFTDNKHEFRTGDVGGVGGYNAYIDSMKLTSQAPTVKLNYKPFRWIAYNLGYTYDQSTYGIRTRAGAASEVAKYTAHVSSAEVTLTPADYFYCSLFYEKRNVLTSTRADGAGGVAISSQVPDYKADVDVVGLNSSYALSKDITLTGGYSMSRSDNFNDYSMWGLPLGLDNFYQNAYFGIKRALSKNSSLELKYQYSQYHEDSNNNIDDYEAHLTSVAMNVAF